jgi:flagellar biosynthesis/type III secretory pathway chaperone
MSQFTDQLKVLLKQDIVDLDELKKLLDQEKITLTTRNTDRIKAIAENKSQKVQQLESRAKIKAKLIANSGLGIKPGEVEQQISSLEDQELTSLWQDSRMKMDLCKDSNLVNGTIISRSMQRTTKLMSIIRGQNNRPQLYGQQGKEQNYSGSHRIGKA